MESPPILSLLTDDLLLQVLSHLPDDSDRKSLRSACRAFLRLDSLHRTQLRILRPEFLPGLLRKYPKLETLDLSVCPRVDDATVSALLSRGRRGEWMRGIKRLVLSRAAGLRSGGLEVLVRACPGLEAVDVSYCCGFGDREAAALSGAAGLRDVRMDKCLDLSDVGLAKVAVGCGRLERLSLKWCLEISDLGVTSDSIQAIGTLQKLEVLAMAGCGLVDDNALRFLGHGCPSLQVLDVSRCDKVSSFGLVSVIRGHIGLRQLDAGVTDKGLVELLSACPNMKILNLTCCDSITDAAVSAIAEYCRSLLSLKVESCNLLTEKSLHLLGSSSLLLKDLDLTDCSGVNDAGKLKCGLCTNISAKGLSHIASNCSKIRELDLYRCTGIGDDGLAALSSGCKKLKQLNLSYCNEVTDRGLQYLSQVEELSDLELRGLVNITDKGLTALAAGCKRLSALDLKHCENINDSGFWSLAYYSRSLLQVCFLSFSAGFLVYSSGMYAQSYGYANAKIYSGLAAAYSAVSNIRHVLFYTQLLLPLEIIKVLAASTELNVLAQINLSHCGISDVGLCMLVGNLSRLQDAKLVNLTNVSIQGFELALRACCVRLKKVKLLASLGFLLSPEILDTLKARGCRIRWD
ncbi:hypothetical protein C3L33_19910, partial [Rhododendron williamsianum]